MQRWRRAGASIWMKVKIAREYIKKRCMVVIQYVRCSSRLLFFVHCYRRQEKQGSLGHHSVEAKNQLARLLKCIDDCCESLEGFQNGHVKLMLYFDAAHVLTEKRVPDGQNMYDVMRSCFNVFLSSPIFVIYLSTDSSICDLTYPGSLGISYRVLL
jgi:hypothetical protein